MHRFRDTYKHLRKNTNYCLQLHSHSLSKPPLGAVNWNFAKVFGVTKKIHDGAIRTPKLVDDEPSHECNGQMDGQNCCSTYTAGCIAVKRLRNIKVLK